MNLRGCGVCIAAFFTVSIVYAVRYGCEMLLAGMLVSLEITKTLVGVIYASSFIADTVFSSILGTFSDRSDSHLLLTSFSAILATGAFLHLWLIGYSSLSISFTVLILFAFPGVYASEESHLSYSTATGFVTNIVVAVLAGKLIFAFISDIWDRIRAVIMCGPLIECEIEVMK